MNRQQATDTTIRARAMHHGEGITLTIEIPAGELPREGENFIGLFAGLAPAVVRAIEAPERGTFRMIRGGKA